jgi:hypothetical protein
MITRESLKAEIALARKQRESFSQTDLSSLVDRGVVQEVLDNLIFFTAPDDFLACADTLLQDLKTAFETVDTERQRCRLRFLTDLTLSLLSFLPRWNLQNTDLYGETAFTEGQVQAVANKVQALVTELEAKAPAVTQGLLNEWRSETTARLEAEDAVDPEAEALALVGGSIDEYITNVSFAIADSQLRKIAEMRAAGETRTEFANDYAAFLQYAMYLGASFVTCNPPLVDVVWATFPERWDQVVDEIIANHPGASDDELARLVTLEVVLDNMRLLRPVFLLTDGQMGCVCFQVNPHNHGDAQAMIADAVFVYEELRERFAGEVPNIVFKLPGTKAGLEACSALTGRGIGVTITVNFGMFQHIPFAKVIKDGQSIYSNLVEMNGRLAFPVRDELLGKLEELAEQGINEAQAREAAAWSGVAVIKRAQSLLEGQGYDLDHVKTLVASLRIYEGEDYTDLPSAFPDITEIIGTSILSVFPNVRRAFDAQNGVQLAPLQIERSVPEHVLQALTHSEIFKQAYYVADRDWVSDDDDHFRPDYELSLDDEQGTASWKPVHDTLSSFSDSYDKTIERIQGRRRLAP